MFMLNITNLQRVKLDYFMFHFIYDKHNMNLAVLIFLMFANMNLNVKDNI